VSKLFADRSVHAKILLTVGLLLLVTGTVGGIAVNGLASVGRKASGVYAEGLDPLLRALAVAAAEHKVVRDLVLHANTPDAARKARYEQDIKTADAAVTSLLAEYVTLPARDGRAPLLASSAESWDKVRTFYTATLLPLSRDRKAGWDKAFDDVGEPLIAAADDALTALAGLETSATKADAAASVDMVHSTRRLLVIVLIAGLVLAVTVGLWVARMITRPLREVATALDAVAAGDLTRQVTVSSRDEVGLMAAAVNRAAGSMRSAMQTIDTSAGTLGSAAANLTGVSAEIAANAADASSQAGIISAAADEVSRNVQTVAASSEQMSASIREISQNANEAVKVASQAVEVAESTNATVTKLGDSSAEIGNVVKVITSIAEQTNLLALNATIEAARAGEAGKGFAVVANEVKDLAQETARATEDISRRVAAIQGDTAGAVEAIGEIGRIIGQINDYQLTIAAATEQQSATTEEMTRNVTEAATGSTEIASNISGVASATEATRAGVTHAQRAAEELGRTSGELQTIVSRFRM
jgi:methyl-accepting chemotaxis protein